MSIDVLGLSATSRLSHPRSTTTDVSSPSRSTTDARRTSHHPPAPPTSGTSTRRSSSTSRPTTTSTTASAGRRGSTSSRCCRGPEPRPDWVVTSQGAIDTDLGILKTGKEADVFLLERADPADPDERRRDGRQALPRSEHRSFHRAASYTEGRSIKRSRDERALKRKSTWGRVVAAGEWAISEWDALKRLLVARPAGPLPRADRRHRDPHGVDHRRRRAGRPRPGWPRPGPTARCCTSYFEQLREFWRRWCRRGSCTATSRRTTSSRPATGW